MNHEYKVLLTNDDGFGAPGIVQIEKELKKIYKDIFVVAPEFEQSGVGHAFTFTKNIKSTFCGENKYKVQGTPADCVKLAVSELLDEKPDFVISGINIGENTGIAGYYSGTIAAAREAAFWGIPGMAFSIHDINIEYLEYYAKESCNIVEYILENLILCELDQSKGYLLNINFPECLPKNIKGLKICKQSLAFYNDMYEVVSNKNDETTYKLYGERIDTELSDNFDSRAVQNKYITITPLTLDATDYDVLDKLSKRKYVTTYNKDF